MVVGIDAKDYMILNEELTRKLVTKIKCCWTEEIERVARLRNHY